MKGLNLTILILVLFHLSPSHTQLLKRIRDRLKQRLGGESIGPGQLAALAVIKNVCGDEPPVACTCQNEDQSSEESDDDAFNSLEDVELVMGFPACIPNQCICSDGSEKSLPKLPDRIKDKLTETLNKIASKALKRMTKICNNEEDEPTICECDDALIGQISFPLENPVELARCKPTRCQCPGSDDWVQIHPGRIVFNQLMSRVCNLNSDNPGITDVVNPEQEVESPSKCTCQDQSEVQAPFNIKTMKKCQPQQCQCGEDNVSVDFTQVKKKFKFFKRRFDKLNKICSNETTPVSCQCSGQRENTEKIEPPFDNLLEVLDCLPEKCTCEDGEEISIKQKAPFNVFTKICGENQLPEECSCENGSTMNPKEIIEENEDASGIVTKIRKVRKNLKRAFKQCKPLSCSCPNGENVPLTMFGCEQGGLPKCPEGSGKKLKCSNGDKVKPLKAALAQSKGQCVCEDGIAPRCDNDEEPTCPNGEALDLSLDLVPSVLSQCAQN